jgi:hypothetical protein
VSVVHLAGRRPGFGVDRLSLSFPLTHAPRPDRFDTVTSRQVTDDDKLTLGVNVPLTWDVDSRVGRQVTSSVFVGAAEVGGKWWGKVESNPARFADPDGCSLLPLDDLYGAAEQMWDVATDYLPMAACELEETRCKRLDIARDFRDVRNPSGFVWGLLNVKRPHARRQYVYSDPSRRNAQTLWAGSGQGGVRLYDQHEAYADKGAPEGSLRWEVEARENWLAKALRSESVTLGRMSTGRLVELAEQRWEWSGMGMTVTSTSDVVTRVEGLVSAGGYPDPDTGEWRTFSAAKADRYLGMLLRESRGVNRRSCKDTAAEYTRIKRTLGLVITPQLFAEQDDVPVGRLDWQTGTEVATAA